MFKFVHNFFYFFCAGLIRRIAQYMLKSLITVSVESHYLPAQKDLVELKDLWRQRL